MALIFFFFRSAYIFIERIAHEKEIWNSQLPIGPSPDRSHRRVVAYLDLVPFP